jgi:O-antigen/teichoic acid export membrane protein
MLKKVFSHSLIYGLAPHIPKLANLLILPIITRFLTPVDYGVAGVIEAYSTALSALQTLGLSVVLSNSFFKKKRSFILVWKEIHTILVVWSLIYSAILGLFLYLIIPEEANENRYIIISFYCVSAVIFNNTINIGSLYFQLLQKPVNIAIISIISGITAVLLNLYTIAYLKLGYLGWFISVFGGNLVTFVLYVYPVYFRYKLYPSFKINFKRLREYLKISLPTIPHYYSTYLLNTSDRLVLDFYKTDLKSIGLYNIGYNFGNYIQMIVLAINQAVSPFYLKLYTIDSASSRETARSLTFLLQAFVLCFCTILSLWLKELFSVLFNNPTLASAYEIGILIVMAYCYRPMYIGIINRYFFHEKTNQLWKITFVAGIINVLSNIVLIPLYGIYAAAATTILSLLYMGFIGYYLKSYKQLKDLNYYPFYWLLLIIFSTTISYFVRDSGLVTKLTLSTIFLLSSYIYCKLQLSKIQSHNLVVV